MPWPARHRIEASRGRCGLEQIRVGVRPCRRTLAIVIERLLEVLTAIVVGMLAEVRRDLL